MLLAGKAAGAGIVFLALTTVISGRPHPTPSPSRANLVNKVPAVGQRNDVTKMQENLRGKGYYRGEVDGVFGLRTRASIRGFQKAENLPATGQLDTQTAGKLGVSPEGRKEIDREAANGKPPAGIERAKGEKRKSKTPDALVVRADEQN
jgi:peptidoglycan hydrolase-like protein with peptidoglycan-binding domain